MKIRKITVFLAAIGVAAALCLTACGSSGSSDGETGGNTAEETGGDTAEETGGDTDEGTEASSGDTGLGTVGYVFTMQGADGSTVSFGADDDGDAVVALLGDADSVYEAESCAGQGTAYIYTYGSVEIETYPDESGANLIAFITLKDDTVATPEGIDLSNTRDEVIAAYGEASSEDDSGLIYEKDGNKLEFLFDGDDMISIQYVSHVAG